ncbi:MAG: type II toxin-antitoxin system VapC family toxin [Thiomargarita sp.]|nr:type II toxin-antitoxin system VapC family toxin [Thiomargarita sp.]
MKWTLRYLLDTDTCIYLLNGELKVKNRVAQVGVESLAVANMTKGELYFGAYNSNQVENNLKRIQAFFTMQAPEVLPLDEKVMEIFGQLKAELRQKGQPIGDIDLLIAGVAISNNLTLVTNNTKHFERIPHISLENWYNTH